MCKLNLKTLYVSYDGDVKAIRSVWTMDKYMVTMKVGVMGMALAILSYPGINLTITSFKHVHHDDYKGRVTNMVGR
jgi:hypothetical protein